MAGNRRLGTGGYIGKGPQEQVARNEWLGMSIQERVLRNGSPGRGG